MNNTNIKQLQNELLVKKIALKKLNQNYTKQLLNGIKFPIINILIIYISTIISHISSIQIITIINYLILGITIPHFCIILIKNTKQINQNQKKLLNQSESLENQLLKLEKEIQKQEKEMPKIEIDIAAALNNPNIKKSLQTFRQNQHIIEENASQFITKSQTPKTKKLSLYPKNK